MNSSQRTVFFGSHKKKEEEREDSFVKVKYYLDDGEVKNGPYKAMAAIKGDQREEVKRQKIYILRIEAGRRSSGS